MADLDFAGLNQRLLSEARSLLPSWLPGGRISGHEYVCANLQGGRGESASVNLNNGRWGDFATGQTGGDLISLYAAVHGLKMGEAYRQLGGEPAQRVAPAAPVAANPPPPKLGPPPADAGLPDLKDAESHWIYRQPDGSPWFVVARYPGKRIRPWSWDLDARKWVPKGLPTPRPLYNLPGLVRRPDAPVLIVEGEKAASAAHKIAGETYVITTWPNGAAAHGAADWTPLHGRKVLIWPDADKPGHAAAAAIADLLGPLCPEVKVLAVADKPDRWDAADALAEGWDWGRWRAWAVERACLWVPRETALAAPAAGEAAQVEVLPPAAGGPETPTARLDVTLAEDDGELPQSLVAIYTTHDLATTGRGQALTNADNIHRALSKVPGFTGLAYYDEFYESIYRGDGQEWTDADTSRLLIRFQRELGFKKVAKDALLDALVVHAHENTRNAPRDWMDTLAWDGQDRLSTFLSTYLGAEPSDYTEAAGRNWWLSMVARIYQPGCKVDTMLILQGEQGRFKSTAFEVIGGPWYAVATASVDDPKAFAETMRGKMILELAELASFGKAEAESIKRLLTDRADRFRVSYGRFAQDHPRRSVLVGTSNKLAVLNDETGGRRFWPVWIQKADLEALRRDRDQLFAQAVALVKQGATWWEMPASAAEEQEAAREHDEWEVEVQDHLAMHPKGVTILDVWKDALSMPLRDLRRAEQLRIAKILRALRWQALPKPVKREGKTVRLWLPMDPPF